MRLGIDLMGGDHPELIASAVKRFVIDYDVTIVGFIQSGNENIKAIKNIDNVEIVYVDDAIEKADDPSFVVRKRKESSLVTGTRYLKERRIDAFISAENTAAIVACGIFVLKRKVDISKPALPIFFSLQGRDTPVMLLDLGANIYPTKKSMMQYAEIANDYMKRYYDVKNPNLKLLNIGEEENKGTEFIREVAIELRESDINFTGNIEPRYIMEADCDIILMDGWTGNIMLKSIEGMADFIGKNLKEVFYKNTKNKIAALTLKGDLETMYEKLDYRNFGGAPVLGVDGLLLKAHGSSDETAFYNALKQVYLMKNKEK